MLKVGLTGGLASGKTFIAERFAEFGAYVIQADRLGHETLLPSGEAYPEVVREFGPEILASDRTIDRRKLGAVVFADQERLERLNALVHPHVFRRQDAFFAEIARMDPAGVAVVEAAIMIETGSYKRYQRLVLAFCPPEEQIRRFMERDKATEREARERLSRQTPLEEKIPFADYLIDTSSSREETTRRARAVYVKLKDEAKATVHS